MDEFALQIIAIILTILGIIGSFLPVLPATPLAFLGVLVFKFSSICQYSWTFVIICGVVTAIAIVLEYLIPILGAKKFGGSKYGTIGATIGLIVGLWIFPPIGFIIGPILGAFIGELLKNRNDVNGALKAALGSFLGFLLSTGINIFFCAWFLYFVAFNPNWVSI